MAFALAAAAGLIAGMAFDIVLLCVLAAPLFVCAFLLAAKGGALGALAMAAKLAATLQFGYMAGLLARNPGA